MPFYALPQGIPTGDQQQSEITRRKVAPVGNLSSIGRLIFLNPHGRFLNSAEVPRFPSSEFVLLDLECRRSIFFLKCSAFGPNQRKRSFFTMLHREKVLTPWMGELADRFARLRNARFGQWQLVSPRVIQSHNTPADDSTIDLDCESELILSAS